MEKELSRIETKKLEREYSRQEMLIKAAKMYYLDGASQEEIARHLNMSRSNISKMLKECRKLGIVEISINERSLKSLQLKSRLMKIFGLKELIITPKTDDEIENKENIGKAVSRYLETIMRDNMEVGLTWGSSIYHVVKALRPTSFNNINVIQLMGGTGMRDNKFDSVALVTSFAEKTGGQSRILNAPLIVKSKELRDLLLEDENIAYQLKLAEKADIALVGLGTNHPASSALVRAGYLEPEESLSLYKDGLYGHICGWHIDIYGTPGDVVWNERIIGIKPSVLRKIPVTIGVGTGANKVKAIISSLRGKYINVLVTDENTASLMMNYLMDENILGFNLDE